MTNEIVNPVATSTVEDSPYNLYVKWFAENIDNNLRSVKESGKRYVAVRLTTNMYQAYLDTFAPEDRQRYTCRACKKFLERFASVALIDQDMDIIYPAFTIATTNPPVEFVTVATQLFEIAKSSAWEIITRTEVPTLVRYTGVMEKGGFMHLNTHIAPNYLEPILNHFVASTINLDGNSIRKAHLLFSSFKNTLPEIRQIIRDQDLRESCVKTLNRLSLLVERYKSCESRANFVKLSLAGAENNINGIMNTLVGKLVADVRDGKPYEQALDEYRAMADPTRYRRPSRLPSSEQLRKDINELKESGLDKALEVRLAIIEDVKGLEETIWVRPEEPEAETGFADKLVAKVENKPKPVKHATGEVENISLAGFIAEMTDYIERGVMEDIIINRHNAGFLVGGVLQSINGNYGELRADGRNYSTFQYTNIVPSRHLNDVVSVGNWETKAVMMQKDPHGKPVASLLLEGKFVTPIPTPIFPEDLKSQYHHLSRTIEAWCKEYPVNVDAEDRVIDIDNHIVSLYINVGTNISVVTDTHVLDYKITSLK